MMMTRVDFHSQVTDKIHYACRLVRKARAAHCQIVVLTEDDAQFDAIDHALWCFSTSDFLPHVSNEDPLAPLTPIVITTSLDGTLPHTDVLINLSQQLAPQFSQFSRVIELVSTDSQDTQTGRQRFRQYQQQGIKTSHTVAST